MTRRPEVLGGIGGFAGLFDASRLAAMDHPVLATSTDGVGTKVAIAQAMDVHDTIGFDLVGMVVDDLVVCGAEPLFMTDYIACGKVDPERIAAIVSGHRRGVHARPGCALLGGETAEHPGLLEPDEYDLAGAATGVVERDRILGADRVEPGDVVLALESSGLHSNGYSLVRHVFFATARLGARPPRARARPDAGGGAADADPDLHRRLPGADRRTSRCTRMSHVTGGGLAGNLARVIPGRLRGADRPDDLAARRRSSAWSQRLGEVSRSDLEATLQHGRRHGCGAARRRRRRGDPAARRSWSAGLGLRLGGARPDRVRGSRSACSATIPSG